MTMAGLPQGEVQVAGHGSTLNKILFATGLIGIVFAIIVSLDGLQLGVVIGVPSLLVVVATAVIGIMRRRRRAWLKDTGDGFVYRNRVGSREIADDEVVGVHLLDKPNFREGVLKSYTRKVNLKVAQQSDIELIHTALVDQVDPLAGFLNRTIDKYRDRADEALEAGVRLKGKNWNLGRDDIEIDGKLSRRVPISKLSAIDTIDGQYHVWDVDSDTPILQVPFKTDNAFLLGLMLKPKIAEQNKDRKFDISAPGLGRQIFRRVAGRLGRMVAWLFILIGAVAILSSIALAVKGVPDAVEVGGICLFLGVCAVLASVQVLRAEFRCHERGVFKRGLIGSSEMRFQNVNQFAYSATRHYYNGVYTGTALNIEFRPTPGTGAKTLRFSRSVKNADDALDGLRDHISRVLTVKMAKKLNETGSVRWMPNVLITSNGLRYRPKGFVGRKDEQLLPFDQISGFDIQDGTFHVWKDCEEKSKIQEQASEPNFFPGYYLLMEIFASDQQPI